MKESKQAKREKNVSKNQIDFSVNTGRREMLNN